MPAAIRSKRTLTTAPAGGSRSPTTTAAASLQSTTDYYHSGQQVIQTDTVSAGGAYMYGYQYTWSPRYVDAPICRDKLNASGQPILPTSGGRIYYLGDADYNVTSAVDNEGAGWAVKEHYAYDPYGTVSVYSADWSTCLGGASASQVEQHALLHRPRGRRRHRAVLHARPLLRSRPGPVHEPGSNRVQRRDEPLRIRR